MFRIIPKEMAFFDLFERLADAVHRGAIELHALLEKFDEVAERAKRIKDIEHEGDEITHETMERLNRTFITPLDREDIHELASGLDDILDLMDTSANRVYLYKVSRPGPEAVRLAACLVHATNLIKETVAHLRHGGKNLSEALRIGREIHVQENEADMILQHALTSLFEKCDDIKDLIKWKNVLEILEAGTDRCEDVGNIVEGIILKNA